MTFSQVQGNEEVKKVLAGMVDAGRVPHAILFHEDDGGGAFPLALSFLQYLFCKHRGLTLLFGFPLLMELWGSLWGHQTGLIPSLLQRQQPS